MRHGIFYNEEEGTQDFINELKNVVNQDTIFICIGTDKCIGDSLGPLVGTMLEGQIKNKVYGTLKNPIHALNLNSKIEEIIEKHGDKNIIAIDACLGDSNSVGEIILKDKPVKPGRGVGKVLRSVGQNSIVGIVDNKDNSMFFSERLIRLCFVYDLAVKISKLIIAATE